MMKQEKSRAFVFDPVTIDVSFHVLYDGLTNDGNVNSTRVTAQIGVLNKAYAPHGFQFRLRELVRTDNADWYSTCEDNQSFKAALHNPRDGPNVLYLYTCQSSSLGFATFPVDAVDEPILDGVVIKDQTLPGGTEVPYNLGITAVHEVGHWLGLLHTFAGGCSGGDFVADTPAQATPSTGCPLSADTCPIQPGLDLVNNYMDYSDDVCLTQFTPGQVIRMQNAWRIYRSKTTTLASTVTLVDRIPLSGQTQPIGSRRTYRLTNIPFLSKVSVKLSGSSGDADLFMELCSSITANNSNEACTTRYPINDGKVLIEVYASAAFANLTILATIEPIKWVDLGLGESVEGLSLATGESLYYAVADIPEETIVQLDSVGETGDADITLYSGSGFDSCESITIGSTETCSVISFLPSTVYIVVTAAEAFDGLSLLTQDTTFDYIPLLIGEPAEAIGLCELASQYFVLTDVPAGSTVIITTSGGDDGDAELTVYRDDFSTPVCVSLSDGSTEYCEVVLEEPGTLFIQVVAFVEFTELTVQADLTVPESAYSIFVFILSVLVQMVNRGAGAFVV
jgi:Pregnancy-associated plasma protein-A